jgi:insulysin
VCQNDETLRREIRRVNSELDPSNDFSREMYLIKSLINPDHPYARLTAGNLKSLESYPAEQGIDVGKRLMEFFEERYLPSRAKLVIISPNDLSSLETWVAPFSSTLSRKQAPEDKEKRPFPELSVRKNQMTAVCLFRRNRAGTRPSPGDDLETLSFYWGLSLDYTGIKEVEQNVVTAPQLGFVLSQILGRRGPGSLYSLLQKRQWTPEGSKGLPRLRFPVDVSGFQLMKLEVSLTSEGFANRSSVIAAVYDAINSLRGNPLSSAPFQVKRELIAQYMTIGQLYGYVLAPRPPDAIELAFDAQLYDIAGPKGVGNPEWRRLPLPQDRSGVLSIQRCLRDTLLLMSDPYNSIIIATASPKAIITSRKNSFDSSLPPMSPASWDIEQTTGARYYFDDMFRLSGKVNEWLVARLMEDELQSPVLNPLIPPMLRAARVPDNSLGLPESNSIYVLDKSLSEKAEKLQLGDPATKEAANYDPTKSAIVRDYWAFLRVVSHHEKKSFLPLPRAPPEPSCRCAFVLQLLSTRPARANVRSAARAELWKTSLEVALSDVAELGAPAGLAYEISFNKYGMRISFLGLSQNIGSYARRLSRRIVEHPTKLLEGPERFPASIVEASLRSANRATNTSPRRKMQTIGLLRESSTTEAAVEAIAFFKSCRGGVCFSEGQ